MKIFKSIVELRGYLDLQRGKTNTIGLVPTMGALHAGHKKLVEESVKSCDITVCSIFVNPTQFNNSEDLLNYPKQLDEDKRVLQVAGCDVVFVPSAEEMYPENNASLSMNFGFLENVLEGAFRPGHFSGVGVVVSKLLNIVQADKAFFGQKDLQQLAVIKKLVKDLNIRTNIISVPTMRESSGLAMSSRNLRLSKEEKLVATNLYRVMSDLKSYVLAGNAIQEAVNKSREKLVGLEDVELEYLEVVNSDTMAKVNEVTEAKNISICIAAQVGEVRLIDNLYLKQEG